MDDSPRSAKRRKLDSTKRIVSSPLAKTPAKRASGRLTTRSVSYTNGAAASDVGEDSPPPQIPPSVKSAKRSTPVKRAASRVVDIYDDIEGALQADMAPRPTRRRLPTASREGTVTSSDASDELQHTVARSPRRGLLTKPKSAGNSRLRNVINGHQEPDEEAADTATTAKARKASSTPKSTARQRAAPRSNHRKTEQHVGGESDGETVEVQLGVREPSTRKKATKRTKSSVSDDDVEEITSAITPKRRQAANKRTEISDSEDELANDNPPRGRKQPANTRRRMNHADHISNQNEERGSDAEDANGQDDDLDVDDNSILGSVLDPTEPSPFNKPVSAQKDKFVPPVIYGNIAAGRELDLLKTVVMERILGKRPSPLVGLDEEYKSVHQLVEQTITAGEGNSMLLIGAHGSGKTVLVNKVLSEVAKDNAGEYHVVRLNGFFHTDDKIALREIWRQLGKEMDIEEDGSGPGKNYADTLATLLALLSHPSEQTGELTDHVAKAVIFIIDEFDLFAQHPRQTLLYNLFDIAQSRKAPIAVLGLTTRIDVTDMLEKRVKSRFSHRYVHLSLAKTFTAFQEVCKACLIVQPENLSVEDRGLLEGGAKGTPAKKGKKGTNQNVLAEWNENIEKLFATPSFLTTHLAPTFYLSKSVPVALTSFLLPLATLSPTTPFTPTHTLTPPDSKLALLPHLSTLALSLIIAAARLDIIHDSDTCNFNMAYDEYATLASKARIQSAAGGVSASSATSKVWGKDVARREWEGLLELGFVVPVVPGQAGGFGMVRCDVALEEIGEVLKRERGVEKGLERWCRSI